MEWIERFRLSTVIDLSKGSIDLDNFLHCAYATSDDQIKEVYRFIKIEYNVAMATDARIASFSFLYQDYADGYYLVYKKSRTSIILYRVHIEKPLEDLGWVFPDIYSVIPQEKRTKTLKYYHDSIGMDAKLNKALPKNSGIAYDILRRLKFNGMFYIPNEDMQPLFFIDDYKTKYSVVMPLKLRHLD